MSIPRERRGRGIAYLVGAGPGDPGLVTLRGRSLLEQADAVVYDALANPDILRDALLASGRRPELHDVGKRGGDPEGSARQERINDLLVRLVREGKRVVRLKGGDPFVFGRGGEEVQALAEAGLPFEVVPGVTAGIAAPAYAGIPVTHRGLATSVTFVTGHEDPMKGAPQVNWSALAASGGTIVLYMGVRKLPQVAESLIAGGLPAEIPAAIVEWGTHARQRTIVATLGTLAERAQAEGIGAPCITIVGWTVVLRDEIAWFDQRPLSGIRILVLRTGDSVGSSKLGDALRAMGADIREVVTTRIVPIAASAIAENLERLTEYRMLVFTSKNAVEHFWAALEKSGRDTRALSGLLVCAVGPATAAELHAHGVVVDIRPRRFVAEALLEEIGARTDVQGMRILHICGSDARDVLQRGLAELGARVDRVHVYETVPDAAGAAQLSSILSEGGIELAAFTSASSVRAFTAAAGGSALRPKAASIGPITSNALRENGFHVAIEAEESTVAGLARAIARAVASDDDIYPEAEAAEGAPGDSAEEGG